MRLRLFVAAGAVFLLAAAPLLAQTNPTGTISGRVLDEQGLAVPGVTVTANSSALQGSRTAITSADGDYILPFLPPGDYSLSFELSGFASVMRTERVRPSDAITVNPTMSIRSVTETVTVMGEGRAEFGQGAQVATSFKADLVEKLPLNRTLAGTVALAPGQAFTLFIEDALQETTITTSGVSAEFGRFAGGVVQALTKSGGNAFSGSYRLNVENDDWTALAPFTNDRRTDKVLMTHEATLGGPLLTSSGSSGPGASRTGRRASPRPSPPSTTPTSATRSGTRAS